MHRFALEEKHIREENLRLQRKLQQEVGNLYVDNKCLGVLFVVGRLNIKPIYI